MRPTVIGVKLGAALVIALGIAGGGTVAYALTSSPVDTTSAAPALSATTDPTETETADPTETETADPTETETETETADPTETETADPTGTETADPTATGTKGPDATGPAARGLCTAWTHHQGRTTGKSADSTAFRALATAAGGQDQVGAYCATVLGTATQPQPSATEDQGSTPSATASGHGKSGGSGHSTTGKDKGGHGSKHGKGHGKGH